MSWVPPNGSHHWILELEKAPSLTCLGKGRIGRCSENLKTLCDFVQGGREPAPHELHCACGRGQALCLCGEIGSEMLIWALLSLVFPCIFLLPFPCAHCPRGRVRQSRKPAACLGYGEDSQHRQSSLRTHRGGKSPSPDWRGGPRAGASGEQLRESVDPGAKAPAPSTTAG